MTIITIPHLNPLVRSLLLKGRVILNPKMAFSCQLNFCANFVKLLQEIWLRTPLKAAYAIAT